MPSPDSLAGLQPTRRVILLGASNLTRYLPTVVGAARRLWNEPLDILAAVGHGRSYGVHSAVLARSLAGIAECGLWQALSDRQRADGALPTAALVTDIGNDVLYGSSVSRILSWVEMCLDRLAPLTPATILTLLPPVEEGQLPKWKFRALRQVFFPMSRMGRDQVLKRATELNARLRTIAAERKLSLIEPRGEWYGFDLIHLRRRAAPHAWSAMLAPWRGTSDAFALSRASFARSCRYFFLPPEQRWWYGCERRHRQPVLREQDGTALSLY